MKELLVLSGKGGTGKTTIASALIKLAQAQAYADCDVDAPNLHLINKRMDDVSKEDYYGLPKAYINENICISCGKCYDNCRFGAVIRTNRYDKYIEESVYKNVDESMEYIKDKKDIKYHIDKFACEGCSVCEFVCPVNAITLEKEVYGEVMTYENPTIFSTAKLKTGSGASGKLVSEVKKQMRLKSKGKDIAISIIDGSPGVGCPVIASLSGVSKVLIVAEPSISGISDLTRTIETAGKFGVGVMICVNKSDINIFNTKQIKELCKEQDIPYVGSIPFDKEAVKAINEGLTIVDIDCISGDGVREIYNNILSYM